MANSIGCRSRNSSIPWSDDRGKNHGQDEPAARGTGLRITDGDATPRSSPSWTARSTRADGRKPAREIPKFDRGRLKLSAARPRSRHRLRYYDRLSLGQDAPGILCAIGITGMQDDPMSLARKQFARHQAKAGGRTGNEDA
jgi:hypothetical protein